MAFSDALVRRVRFELASERGVTERKMFGMLGFFVHGNLCVGVWETSLIARIEPDTVEAAVTAPHASRFEVRGKALRGWVLIAPEGLETDPQLAHWIGQALQFVHGLPRK